MTSFACGFLYEFWYSDVCLIKKPLPNLSPSPESVSIEDVQRVAQKMHEQSPLALAALGDLTSVPRVKEVEDALISNKGVLMKRNKLFSFR